MNAIDVYRLYCNTVTVICAYAYRCAAVLRFLEMNFDCCIFHHISIYVDSESGIPPG